jgi:hypothetical protein
MFFSLTVPFVPHRKRLLCRRDCPRRLRRAIRNDAPCLGPRARRRGARTRAGHPCRQAAVTGRSRCRIHGGARGSGGVESGVGYVKKNFSCMGSSARFKAGPVGRSRLRRRRPAAGTSASAARSSQSHPLRLSDSLLAAPIRVATCRSLRRDRPLKIQRKNSGSGNKARNWHDDAISPELGSFCQKSHLIAGFN